MDVGAVDGAGGVTFLGPMEGLVAGDLRIDVEEGPPQGGVRLWWRGKSNDRQPGKVLGPYLAHVLDAATQRQIGVEMHFEQLDHFNSATITSIVQAIQDARSRGVRLVLIYDKALKWQKLSFEALRVLAKGELKAALNLSVAGASKAAIEAIEKVGGKIALSRPVKEEAAAE